MMFTNTPKTGQINAGIRAYGNLTEVEQEHHCLKGHCYYYALALDLPAPDFHNA